MLDDKSRGAVAQCDIARFYDSLRPMQIVARLRGTLSDACLAAVLRMQMAQSVFFIYGDFFWDPKFCVQVFCNYNNGLS